MVQSLFSSNKVTVGYQPDSATGRNDSGHTAAQGRFVYKVDQKTADLLTIRNTPLGEPLSFNEVIKGTVIASQQDLRLSMYKVFEAAKITEGDNRGRELRQLVTNVLAKDVSLVAQLEKVATADTLFGKQKSQMSAQEFEQMRREYLVSLIRGTVSSDAMNQGPRAMCTETSCIKDLAAGELLGIGCNFALNGEVRLASGKVVVMDPAYLERAKQNATCPVGDLKSARPPVGFLALLDGLATAGCSASSTAYWQDRGMYPNEYVNMRRNLTGHNAKAMARDGVVTYDPKTNQAVESQATAKGKVQQLGQMEYLKARLTGDPRKAVLIDTLWDHSRPGSGADAMHARHMLLAQRVVSASDLSSKAATNPLSKHGGTFFECDNPIGDFMVGGAKVKPGEVLGNKNGFWFVTGENGKVYVREDVLKQHLQVVVVDYAEKYTHPASGIDPEPEVLGTLPVEYGSYEVIIPEEYSVQGIDKVETIARRQEVDEPTVKTDPVGVSAPSPEQRNRTQNNPGPSRTFIDEQKEREERERALMASIPDLTGFQKSKHRLTAHDQTFVPSPATASKPPPQPLQADGGVTRETASNSALKWGFNPNSAWKPSKN